MSSLDDLLREKDIFYLKDRMKECGINTVGDLEYIISDEEVSQTLAIKVVEKIKIKEIIEGAEGKDKDSKNVSFCHNH